MTYSDALQDSMQFFGKFFSITANIWFKKYRDEQDEFYEYRHKQAVWWFTGMYVALNIVLGMLIFAILLIILPNTTVLNGSDPTLGPSIMAAVIAVPVVLANNYGFWPYMYWVLVRLGVVRKRLHERSP